MEKQGWIIRSVVTGVDLVLVVAPEKEHEQKLCFHVYNRCVTGSSALPVLFVVECEAPLARLLSGVVPAKAVRSAEEEGMAVQRIWCQVVILRREEVVAGVLSKGIDRIGRTGVRLPGSSSGGLTALRALVVTPRRGRIHLLFWPKRIEKSVPICRIVKVQPCRARLLSGNVAAKTIRRTKEE